MQPKLLALLALLADALTLLATPWMLIPGLGPDPEGSSSAFDLAPVNEIVIHELITPPGTTAILIDPDNGDPPILLIVEDEPPFCDLQTCRFTF